MDIAAKLMNLEPSIRSGTLRMFGCWFGRPMDNIHEVTSAQFVDETLKISFSEGEVLEVLEPSDILVQGTTVIIPEAKKVKWSWFYYGKPKTEGNLLSLEYLVQGKTVSIKTKIALPEKANYSKPAVEIC